MKKKDEFWEFLGRRGRSLRLNQTCQGLPPAFLSDGEGHIKSKHPVSPKTSANSVLNIIAVLLVF